jgi:peptide/nickel transport system substrate-binding protein
MTRAVLRPILRIALLLLPALAAGCGDGADEGPLTVSVIGDKAKIVDPNRHPLTAPEAALMQATAQGLIRFDGGGQIEPGLAIRWDVSDDGLYYTFRLDDRANIDADNIARRLRVAIARSSRNPLRPMLGAIDEIVAVTPEVIEIRLTAPRPNLLQLLAQPEMGLAASRTLGGTGPLRIVERGTSGILLGPIADKAEREPPSEAEIERRQVRLRGERAALAVVRFRGGGVQAVLGGRFQDLAIARAANLPAPVLRFDPVAGLFGFAVADAKGLAGEADARRALAMAIDRERIVAAFGVKGWRSAITLVPGGIADLATPVAPDWAVMPLADRRTTAAGTIARLRADQARKKGADDPAAPPPPLRVALPKGPGARLLFALVRADWARIGVAAEAVGPEDKADLRLIDLVAPADSASWYLRQFTCDRSPACDAAADEALASGREAASLPERNVLLAQADQALARATPFIPIAMPLRWSLVSPQLSAFKENARAAHPLNHLRPERR